MNHDGRDELHRAALRATPARLGVLDALEHAEYPLDAAAIKAYLQKRSIAVNEATVFRVLRALVKKGIAKPVQLHEGKQRFEYANQPSHHHFVCRKCGSILDVSGCVVDPWQKALEETQGIKIERHSLEFFGLCGRCRA